MQKQVLKGTRWLLLKNPENLEEKKDEKRRLKEALALNEPLATAYYLVAVTWEAIPAPIGGRSGREGGTLR